MHNIIVQILAAFIPNKDKRKAFRNKYKRKSIIYPSWGSPLQLDAIQNTLESMKKMLTISMDITKLPPATGNLKMVQDCSVALLNHFNDICKKYNIQYWIDSGTLIGYHRPIQIICNLLLAGNLVV